MNSQEIRFLAQVRQLYLIRNSHRFKRSWDVPFYTHVARKFPRGWIISVALIAVFAGYKGMQVYGIQGLPDLGLLPALIVITGGTYLISHAERSLTRSVRKQAEAIFGKPLDPDDPKDAGMYEALYLDGDFVLEERERTLREDCRSAREAELAAKEREMMIQYELMKD